MSHPASRTISQRIAAWLHSRSARIGIIVLALVLLLGLLTPYLLDANRYRGTIAGLIAQQTGRQVTLGKIRARLLPRVGFTVEGFRMSNPPGFAGDFVSAAEIRGSLAFWQLVLHHQVHLASVELDRPKLMLLEDDAGGNNYTFPSHEAAATAPAVPSRQPGAERNAEAGASTWQIDALSLKDAEVVYGSVSPNGEAHATADASGFSVELRHLSLAPLRVRDWQADTRLNGAKLKLARWNGAVTFRTGNARLRNGGLDATFAIDFGGATQANGTLSVPNVERAVVKFDLKTSDLDLAALAAGAEPAAPAVAPKANPPVNSGAKTSTAAPPAANAPPPAITSLTTPGIGAVSAPAASDIELLVQGHLSADHVHLGPYVTEQATADVRLYNDRLEIWPVTIRLYDGALQISARTDRRQSPMRYSANLQARDLSVEEMLNSSPSLRGQFAGTGEFDLQIFGSLDSAWEKSLAGTGQFAIRNGRIRGFNLAGAAQSIANLAGVSGDTPFTAITGDVDIHDQRAFSRDIHLDSPRGTADLAGSFGLDGGLSYDGQITPQLQGTQLGTLLGSLLAKNGGQLTVPFGLRGTLEHPELVPSKTKPAFPPPQPQQKSCCSFPNLFSK